MDETPQASSPVAVTILSGFLGSGKTTLLNDLLRASHGKKMAVIVNELGSVGIDGALVAGGEQFVELDNGCLCCALNDDLQKLLEDLLKVPGLTHILIETTGLADPLPVAWTCTRPQLSARLRVDAIVTVADVLHLDRALAEAPEAHRQIERADLLILKKLDLVTDEGKAARKKLNEINTLAPQIAWPKNNIPWELVLGHERQGLLGHTLDQHGAHHQQPMGLLRYTWTHPGNIPLDERKIEDLTLEIPADVFRFKGLLRVDASYGSYLEVNGVAGRIDLRFLHPQRPPPKSVLVFFGKNIDEAILKSLCDNQLLSL